MTLEHNVRVQDDSTGIFSLYANYDLKNYFHLGASLKYTSMNSAIGLHGQYDVKRWSSCKFMIGAELRDRNEMYYTLNPAFSYEAYRRSGWKLTPYLMTPVSTESRLFKVVDVMEDNSKTTRNLVETRTYSIYYILGGELSKLYENYGFSFQFFGGYEDIISYQVKYEKFWPSIDKRRCHIWGLTIRES